MLTEAQDAFYQVLTSIVHDSDSRYESEYDGRMYSYCRYCNQGDDHDKDCLLITSEQMLTQFFSDRELLRLQKIEQEQEKKRAEKLALDFQRPKDACQFCQTYINKHDMTSHVHSVACKKRQRQLVKQGLLDAVDPTVKVIEHTHEQQQQIHLKNMRPYYYNTNKAAKVGDVIFCPWCGKTFTKEHYQQIFCKIPCKDDYWNFIRR